MPGSPYRTQKPNTPLSDEEQVWDVIGIGIREPEKDPSEGYSFSFPLETVFKVRSPLLDPGAVEGNGAGLRRLHGLRKRIAPGGRAPPPRTNPERASNFRGVSCCRFRRWFERLKHLRFDDSLTFICETGNPTAS